MAAAVLAAHREGGPLPEGMPLPHALSWALSAVTAMYEETSAQQWKAAERVLAPLVFGD